MPAKLTQEEAVVRFKEKGFELLGKYIDSRVRVPTKCHCGNIFEALPVTIFGGIAKSCGCIVRIDQEEVKKRLKKYGYKLLGEFTTTKSKILVQCHCGTPFYATVSSITQGNVKSCGCIIYNRLSQEEAAARFKKLGLKLLGEYSDSNSKTLVRCRCGKEFETTPYSAFAGGTKSCGCSRKSDTKTIEKRISEKKLKLLGEYNGINRKTLVRCHCGKEFMVRPDSICGGKTKSCGCIGSSTGEKAIVATLEKYGCLYIKEWTREGYRNVYCLRYDFYLPQHNAIIEFNGKQHFKPVCFGGSTKEEAEEVLIKLQARDKEKREWAAANGIPLLDINYDEIDQIEDKVWNFLMMLRNRKEQQVA